MVKVYKNVCITGAGNGIGRAIAIAMSNEGYNVVCADIDLKQAKDTLDFILNKQGSGIAVETDVTKAFDIKNMINSTVDEFGSLDILVNNAGVTRTSNIMDLTEKDWYWINDVNAKGTFFSLQAAAKQMIKQNQGGRIINMASVGGKGFVDVSNAIYAASKGAVISLTKTAAQELAKYEITVNSICPGITHTNILSGIVKKRALEQNKSEEEIMRHYARDIPLKRPNDPEDIAEMVVFLSSKGARNISGQSYNIDGDFLSQTFSFLRSNDLIYGPAVKSYLMGKKPPPFDLLYWNSDCTNLPGKMALEYLEKFYKNNDFSKGKLEVLGEKVNLEQISQPIIAIGTFNDHIAPWKSSFNGLSKTSGEKVFILAGSGHIAGIINPEHSNKYGYWINNENYSTPEKWFNSSINKNGSWWNEWYEWKKQFLAEKIISTKMIGITEIEPAPGRYVKKKNK